MSDERERETRMSACTEIYAPQGQRPGAGIPCIRDMDATGRHRGDHQGWESMPSGSRENVLTHQVETWPVWGRLWTWSAGGATGEARHGPGYTCMGCAPKAYRRTHEPEDHGRITCPACGVLHDPYGHHRDGSEFPSDTEMWCFSCALWDGRARSHGQIHKDTRPGMTGRWSRAVRPHGDTLAGDTAPRLYGWSHGHGGAFGGRQFTVTWDDGQTAGPADYLWDSGEIPWWLLDAFPTNATLTAGVTVPRPGYTDSFGRPLAYTAHPAVTP